MHEPKTLRSPHFRGKFILTKHIEQSVLNTEVSVCQGCPLRGVPLYTYSVLIV